MIDTKEFRIIGKTEVSQKNLYCAHIHVTVNIKQG